jgi:hypothetical protein
MRWVFVALAVALGCKERSTEPVRHVELRRVGGESIELVPLAGTPSNCLVFSASQSGVVRQLTMNEDNTSVDCTPGQPIGKTPFRIPAREGKVRIYAVFSDQKLTAGPIAEQIEELGRKPEVTMLDLRAPGHVVGDMIEFTPEAAR